MGLQFRFRDKPLKLLSVDQFSPTRDYGCKRVDSILSRFHTCCRRSRRLVLLLLLRLVTGGPFFFKKRVYIFALPFRVPGDRSDARPLQRCFFISSPWCHMSRPLHVCFLGRARSTKQQRTKKLQLVLRTQDVKESVRKAAFRSLGEDVSINGASKLE